MSDTGDIRAQGVRWAGDIPGHLEDARTDSRFWEAEARLRADQDSGVLNYEPDDYVDPDTEPMPGLDEAVGHVRDLIGLIEEMNVAKVPCCGLPRTGHVATCAIRAPYAWLAAHTNDEGSDLPW